MKNRLIRSLLSLALVASLLLPGCALALKPGDPGEFAVSSDMLLDSESTFRSKDINNIIKTLDGYVTSDSDINFSDEEIICYNDTKVPIEVADKGDIVEVYNSDDIIQWVQKLKLSNDQIAKLWEEYKLGGMPPEAVNTVISNWDTLVENYKKFYEGYGLKPGDIEKLISQIQGELKAKVPELPSIFDEKVKVTPRTDPDGDKSKTLGKVRDRARAILLAWANDLYQKNKKLMLGKVSAGTQVYADSDYYDPEKATHFSNQYNLLNNMDSDSTFAMLGNVYDQINALEDYSGPLNVPKLDAKGQLQYDENGQVVYEKKNKADITPKDFMAMGLEQYAAYTKILHPEMTDAEIAGTVTYKNLQELASSDSKAAEVLTDLSGPDHAWDGKTGNLGFSDPELKKNLDEKTQRDLEKQLDDAKSMVDPNTPAVTTVNNVAMIMFSSPGVTNDGFGSFSTTNMDQTVSTREQIARLQKAYKNEANNIEHEIPMAGKTAEEIYEAVCRDIVYENDTMLDQTSSACYAHDESWSDNPLGEYHGYTVDPSDYDIASPAEIFVSELKSNPQLFDSDGKFIDHEENNKAVADIYSRSVSGLTSQKTSFTYDDYVIEPSPQGAIVTVGNGIVTAEASMRMEKEINSAVDAYAGVGIKLKNVSAKTGYYMANSSSGEIGIIDLSDPNEAQAYREAVEMTERMSWRDSGTLSSDGVNLDDFESNLRYCYDKYGVDRSKADAICASCEMQKELSGTNVANIHMSYDSYTGTAVSDSLANSVVGVNPLLYVIMDEPLPEVTEKQVKADIKTPTDLNDELGEITVKEYSGKSEEELSKEFLGQYMTDKSGFMPASEFMTDANRSIWYELNPEIYANEKGGLFSYESDVGVLGFFARAMGFEVLNTVTGQIEHIQGATGNNGYIGFCAASNGYIYTQNAAGEWGFIKKEDYLKIVKQCASDHGVDPNLIGNVYVYVDSNGKQQIGLEYDIAAGLLGAGNPLPLNKLKELMDEYERSLKDMAEEDGVGEDMIDWDGLGDILGDFNPANMDDWREAIKKYLESQGYNFTDGDVDAILQIIKNVLTDEDIQNILNPPDGDPDEEPQDENPDDDSNNWTWEDIVRMFEEMFGPFPDGTDIPQFIIEHLPEFLLTYNGQKLFTVNRIITKQISGITVDKTSSQVRTGGYMWDMTYPSGAKDTRYGQSFTVILAKGTTSGQAYTNVQDIYLETTSYDYKEEWVLEGLDKNYVIYSREIKGYLPGHDSEGTNVLRSVVHYGESHEQKLNFVSYTTDEEAEDPSNIIGTGTVEKFVTTGTWINGVLVVQQTGTEIDAGVAPETSTYRVD